MGEYNSLRNWRGTMMNGVNDIAISPALQALPNNEESDEVSHEAEWQLEQRQLRSGRFPAESTCGRVCTYN